MDGKVSNDGASLGFASRFPIITDRTELHFSQSRHNFFTDAGISKFLSSLGGIGMYLGLTGSPLKGRELMYFGVGKYYIEHCCCFRLDSCTGNLDDLMSDLSLNHSRNASRIEDIIKATTVPFPNPDEDVLSLCAWYPSQLDRFNEISQLFNPCFISDKNVLDLLHRLESTSDFSRDILSHIQGSTALLQVITPLLSNL